MSARVTIMLGGSSDIGRALLKVILGALNRLMDGRCSSGQQRHGALYGP